MIEENGDHVPQNYEENKRRYAFLKEALLGVPPHTHQANNVTS